MGEVVRGQSRKAAEVQTVGLCGCGCGLPAADTYFRLAALILAARATGQYEEAMLLAKHAWPLIPRALQGELAGVDPQEIRRLMPCSTSSWRLMTSRA